MRVAVSALDGDIHSKVDERFGRAVHFIVHDTQTRATEVIDNTKNRNALQGSGIASAELIAGAGATAVITGHLGPKAFAALNIAGIKGYSGVGMTVHDALEAFESDALEQLTEPGEAHQA